MSIPLTADQLVAALRAEGVNVREYGSWRTHNRDAATGRTFGPVNGVTIHHTAGRDSLALCYNGLPDLPGPLCHTHLSKAGVATMVGHGRANHAGTFAQNAHDAVIAESSVHPRPDAAEPVDGNDHYYGIEIENLGDGKDPYPAVQYDQAVRWAAAICRAHGWSANSVIGHKEGTRRKIDPSFDMNAFRARVDERLAHPADWNPTEEDTVALTAEERAWLKALYDGRKIDPWTYKGTGETLDAYAYLRGTSAAVKALTAKADAQGQTITQLVQTVAQLAAGIGDLDPAAIVTELKTAIEAIDIRLDIPEN